MKVSNFSDLGKTKDPSQFITDASPVIKECVDVINGNIEFDDNIKSQTVSVTFSSANSNTAVIHKLGKTGVKYFPVKKSAACDVYDGNGQSNSGVISLKGTSAATVTLVLY